MNQVPRYSGWKQYALAHSVGFADPVMNQVPRYSGWKLVLYHPVTSTAAVVMNQVPRYSGWKPPLARVRIVRISLRQEPSTAL